MQQGSSSLSDKIHSLPPEQIAEVEEFIARLSSRDPESALRRSSATISKPAFAAVWNNPEDDAYDAL
jgi:hypothetical protein